MPNTEKLFMYVQKGSWHNVTPSSTGFVKKEYFQHLAELEADEREYKSLRLMIEHAEMGRYTEAKNLFNDAHTQFQNMVSLVMEKRKGPPFSPRRTSRQGRENANYVEQNRAIYTPNYGKNQDTYREQTPRQLEIPQTPLKDRNENRVGYGGGDEPPRSPIKNQPYSNQERMDAPRSPMKDNPQDARYTLGTPAASRGGTPRTPLQQADRNNPSRDGRNNVSRDGRNNVSRDGRNMGSRDGRNMVSRDGRNIVSRGGRSNVDYDSEEERKEREKLHKENYEILRVHSPDKKVVTNRYESPLPQTPGTNREPSYKPGNNSYREPSYKHGVADQQREHKDIWGQDFGDTEQEKARDSTYSSSSRDSRSPNKRMLETPDSNPHTATELAKKFRELYLKEWQDAYDEICKTFGPERTVRHLLWIVTESSLIANEIASAQMRDLEKSAFGVMRTPGPEKEHPSEGPLPRNLGEQIPKSRSLLMRYRRQTADLSIPYIKEECRNKVCDSLLESNFPRAFLSSNTRLLAYINKCAEVTWLLCVQSPPLVMEYVTKNQEGSRFDNDLYTQYTKPGMSYDFGVWPLLRQDKGGPIISKGIAQGI